MFCVNCILVVLHINIFLTLTGLFRESNQILDGGLLIAKLVKPVVTVALWSEFNPLNAEEEPAL